MRWLVLFALAACTPEVPPARFEFAPASPIAVGLDHLRGVDGPLRVGEGELALVFWATWCRPCVEELPALLSANRAGQRPRLVLVATDVDWRVVVEHFAGEVPAEVVYEPDRRLERELGVSTLPDAYRVERDGEAWRVTGRHLGPARR